MSNSTSDLIKTILHKRDELNSRIGSLSRVIDNPKTHERNDGTVNVRVYDIYNNSVDLKLESSELSSLLFNERQALQVELNKINLKLSAIGALLGSNNELS